MNLNQLEAFSIIVREKSFSKAAEMMHLTQSAISIRISKLEAEIETDLFIRDGRTIRLSKYGEMYLPYVQRILTLAQESKMMLHQSMNEEKLHLQIGTTSRIATYLLPILLEQFQNVMPQIDISIQTGLSEQVLEMLHDDTIHIGLINDPPEDERWDKLLLFRDRILLVSSPNHPLYGQYRCNQQFSIQSLHGVPIINAKNPSAYFFPLAEWLRTNEVIPKQYISVDNIEAMKRLAARKVGVAFLPQMAVMSEMKTGELVEIPFGEQHQFSRETFLVYKRRKHMNVAISSFVSVIQQYLVHHLLDKM